MADVAAGSATGAVIELLSRRPRRAYFVAEIGESLRRAGVSVEDLDESLTAIESTGRVLLRLYACADPHLEGADLRIAALIDSGESGQDAQTVASELIDRTWQRWIGDYLANHRCM